MDGQDSTTDQDGLALLGVGAVHRGEVGVGVFLLGDRNRWSKAEGLEGLSDEDVSDAVEGRVDELQRAASVQTPARREGPRTSGREHQQGAADEPKLTCGSRGRRVRPCSSG